MLTFDHLREVNTERCEESFHPIEDWSLTDWGCAAAGEMGELCNSIKKIRRLETGAHWQPSDASLPLMQMAADEMADVVIYLDLLATRMGIDLGEAVKKKFNETSKKVGSTKNL